MQNQPTNVTNVLTNGKYNFNPNVNTYVNKCSTKQVNVLLKDNADLIPTGWKSLFAKRFYELTPEQVMKYAAQARADGRVPAKLFNFLTKG